MGSSNTYRFNVRVYGLVFQKVAIDGNTPENCVLLSREYEDGPELIKFPGGGIEEGEGPGDALKREFVEEVNCSVELQEFFHLSPNYHKSYFSPRTLMAFYWNVEADAKLPESFPDQPIAPGSVRRQQLFWKPVSGLSEADVTHTTDREVVAKLKAVLAGS